MPGDKGLCSLKLEIRVLAKRNSNGFLKWLTQGCCRAMCNHKSRIEAALIDKKGGELTQGFKN